MLCVQFLFWYIAHNWNYGILATPARTIVKTRLKLLMSNLLKHTNYLNAVLKSLITRGLTQVPIV